MKLLWIIWFSLTGSTLLNIQEEIKKVYREAAPYVVTVVYSNKVGGGVIYDSSGLIVTSLPFPGFKNFYIIDFKGDTVSGEIKYWDEFTHVAFLQSGLKRKEVRKTHNVEKGDIVIIIGNSSGIENSITLSIVSGEKKKRVYIQGNMIPGQTGAPVFNIKGELIGIVKGKLIEFPEIESLPFSQSRGTGIISVIPCSEIENIKVNIGKEKFKLPGWLGVLIKEEDIGVVIKKVFKGSPAEKFGIKRGDIILKLGNTKIDNVRYLINVIRKYSPGEEVELTIQRGNSILVKKVVLGEKPFTFPH